MSCAIIFTFIVSLCSFQAKNRVRKRKCIIPFPDCLFKCHAQIPTLSPAFLCRFQLKSRVRKRKPFRDFKAGTFDSSGYFPYLCTKS